MFIWGFMQLRTLILSSLVVLGAGAHAAEPLEAEEKVAEVAVSGIRNPELKPYRVMWAGLDAFDEQRKLAPNATLKFRLSKRSEGSRAASNWSGVTLRLAGNDTSTALPIDADGSFVLPRSKEAYDDEAELILNQKKASARFSVDVRTPGLPANVRRLGDLRLECQVLIAIGKKELNFATRAAFTTAFGTANWCSAPRAKVATTLPDWSMHTTIVDGATRRVLAPHPSHFNGPIQDKTLSDEALLEFEFWGGASAERKQQFVEQWPLLVRTSMNKWAEGAPLRLKDKGIYSAVMALKPGSWKFNIESPGREINLGSGNKHDVTPLGAEQALQWHGERLNLQVTQAGQYTLTLNLRDPDHPAVSIQPVDQIATPPDTSSR